MTATKLEEGKFYRAKLGLMSPHDAYFPFQKLRNQEFVVRIDYHWEPHTHVADFFGGYAVPLGEGQGWYFRNGRGSPFHAWRFIDPVEITAAEFDICRGEAA